MLNQTHQSQGFGYRINSYIEEKLIGHFTNVRLGCIDQNELGLSFWKKCGSEKISTVDKEERYQIVVLEKEI